jgi:hypothetical protein
MTFAPTGLSYDPNARYDCGPNAAGCGRVANNEMRALSPVPGYYAGLNQNGATFQSTSRTGFSAAGVIRANTGPNRAGRPLDVNDIPTPPPVFNI